jgi:hypothetical protein
MSWERNYFEVSKRRTLRGNVKYQRSSLGEHSFVLSQNTTWKFVLSKTQSHVAEPEITDV